MNEANNNNVFRFSLTQGEILLCEKMFNADNFNPFTRYSIDIRDILPRAITKLQKTLSRRSYDVFADTGRIDVNDINSENDGYDLYNHYTKMINLYPKEWRNSLRYSPQSIVQQIEHKTIRGVPCKIGLYINENPIVEREFFVDGFNPVARQSHDLTVAVVEITDLIYNKIKNSDVKNMWDDYDLINYRRLSINQIRELSNHKRQEMLRRINRH
ncbi:MAG: hypothetical protein PF487_00225 [Bacteroidales bacterium]|jgi:hypothetical protein|nr:hypothetical protein [Bacteroidales bacterium]